MVFISIRNCRHTIRDDDYQHTILLMIDSRFTKQTMTDRQLMIIK